MNTSKGSESLGANAFIRVIIRARLKKGCLVLLSVLAAAEAFACSTLPLCDPVRQITCARDDGGCKKGV